MDKKNLRRIHCKVLLKDIEAGLGLLQFQTRRSSQGVRHLEKRMERDILLCNEGLTTKYVILQKS